MLRSPGCHGTTNPGGKVGKVYCLPTERKRRASPIKDDETRKSRSQRNSDNIRDYENQEEEPITRTINVIARGFVGGGITKFARKKASLRGFELVIWKDKEDTQATTYSRL